jgi:hypothetical protein
MRANLSLVVSLLGSAIVLGSTFLMLGLVITSILIGGEIDFPGQPEIADADTGLGS